MSNYYKHYNPEEDAMILTSENLSELTNILGRTQQSLACRRSNLRKRIKQGRTTAAEIVRRGVLDQMEKYLYSRDFDSFLNKAIQQIEHDHPNMSEAEHNIHTSWILLIQSVIQNDF